MSDLVVHGGVFGSPLHMFGSALRSLCNPHGCEVGIDNPETDDSYINILAIGTLDKEIFLDMFADFRIVHSYQQNYSKRIENLVGCFIETWLKSNEREDFNESPYREFLAK